MNKNIKHFFFLSGLSAGCIYGINKFINTTSGIKNLLSDHKGYFFTWRYETIFYTKQGSGSPLLLIHDLHPASSSAEWNLLIKKLEKDHTVYTIDLLGCGRSDKPNLTYTNYMFVQLITDFVKNVIEQKTDVIATGTSCSFTLMAAHMNNAIFDKLFFINPPSLESLQQTPCSDTNILKKILEFPVLGTFFYHIQMTEQNIANLFETKYHSKKSCISGKIKDTYYESAHAGHSRGKYLFGSILGNYTNINIIPALKKVENPIFLIVSDNHEDSDKIITSYTEYDELIETASISDCGKLPQLEEPEQLYRIISRYYE